MSLFEKPVFERKEAKPTPKRDKVTYDGKEIKAEIIEKDIKIKVPQLFTKKQMGILRLLFPMTSVNRIIERGKSACGNGKWTSMLDHYKNLEEFKDWLGGAE